VKMQHPTVKDKLAGESKFFIALGKISPFGYFLQPIFLLVVEETKRLNRFSVFFDGTFCAQRRTTNFFRVHIADKYTTLFFGQV